MRLGLDWSWLQPSAGAIDGDAAEFYLGLTQVAKSSNVTLQFTLLERDVPKWFDNEGGFADAVAEGVGTGLDPPRPPVPGPLRIGKAALVVEPLRHVALQQRELQRDA